MPPPLLTTLSARSRLAYPIIQRGVREGLSSRQIMGVLDRTVGQIRRQSLLDIMRAERGVAASGVSLRALRRNFHPDPRRLPDALTKTLRSFSFTVKISGFDLETGEDVIQYVNVALDDTMTRGEIENIGLGLIEEEAQRYGFAVTDVLIERGVKAGDPGTLLSPRAA